MGSYLLCLYFFDFLFRRCVRIFPIKLFLTVLLGFITQYLFRGSLLFNVCEINYIVESRQPGFKPRLHHLFTSTPYPENREDTGISLVKGIR